MLNVAGDEWFFRSTRNPKIKKSMNSLFSKIIDHVHQTSKNGVFIEPLLGHVFIDFHLAFLTSSSCSSCKAWSISAARGGEALVVQSSTFSRCCHPFGCPGYTLRKFASSSAWWCAGSTSGADLVKFGALTNISTSKLELLNLWF